MKVICSWCRSEGRPALVWEKAPLADGRETHGICAFHLQHIGAARHRRSWVIVPGEDKKRQ